MVVSNFKGKEILDNLRELKVEYDRDYFNRQTYKEFLVDPLGSKLIDAWAASDPTVIENVKAQGRLVNSIKKIADVSQITVDMSVPSQKKQRQLEEEERIKNEDARRRAKVLNNLSTTPSEVRLSQEQLNTNPNEASKKQFALKLKQ